MSWEKCTESFESFESAFLWAFTARGNKMYSGLKVVENGSIHVDYRKYVL